MKEIKKILFFCLMLSSCKGVKTIDYTLGELVFSCPDNLKFIEEAGIDSYVAILTDSRDTFHLEYGKRNIVYKFYSIGPTIFNINQKDIVTNHIGKELLSDDVVFSKFPEEDEEQKIFDDNYFMYDTINNIIVKKVLPKKIGKGTTGLYIPELRDGNAFSIYGVNLDSSINLVLVNLFQTIRYK
jgi:hypothetical protein